MIYNHKVTEDIKWVESLYIEDIEWFEVLYIEDIK